jgi:DNA-binding CsgD family transcriptional regulator
MARPDDVSADDPLAAARAALAECSWQRAHDAAAAATVGGDAALAAERLEVLAEAAWWLGRLDDCIAAREAAYLGYEELGDLQRAGECAVWLYEHHLFGARPAMAGGWLRRARRALDDDRESAAYGALVLREAEQAHGAGELERGLEGARSVVALGRRLRSADLEAEALQTEGRLRIDLGDPAEGLALLDEAMLFAVEGRLRPYSTGKVYCSLISACEALGDLSRAAEWSAATARWAEQHPMAVFPGLCRVHLASSLRSSGRWDEAEAQARRACAELATLNVANAAAGHAEVGEIRRRLGDLAGAEAAFAEAERLSGQPQPGLALVRLAQGNIGAARAIIDRALGDVTWDRLGRARLLPAQVQISIAAGDLPGAAEALAELHSIAEDFASPSLMAAALTARGRLELASDDRAACATLWRASDRWLELGVPHEAATARMLQGSACRKAGDADGAAAAFAAARDRFERLGADLDLRHLRDVSTAGATPLPAGLSAREAEVLRLVAEGLTNKQIAQRLTLSEKTVSRHLSNIFTKIGVTSRAAATAFAFEHRLVT